jgi:hypothetical protein
VVAAAGRWVGDAPYAEVVLMAAVGGEASTVGKEAWCGARVGDTATTLARQQQCKDGDSAIFLVQPGRWRWYGGLPQWPS